MNTLFLRALLLITICSPAWLNAQEWVLQNTGTSADIFEARFFDKDNGIAAAWLQPGAAELLRTTNGGSTWNKTYEDNFKGMTGVTLISPTAAVAVGGTNNAGVIFTSQNKGGGWTQVVEADAAKPSFWCIDFADQKVGYAGGGNGVVYKTTNGGSSWTQTVNTPGTGAVVAIDFVSPSTGYAVVASQPTTAIIGTYLYKTTDGGASWKKNPYTYPILCGVHFSDEQHGYAVGHSGSGPTVWRTSNGGESWERKVLGSSVIVYLTDIEFTPENPYVGYAVGGDIYNKKDGMIARTTDGGETWTTEKSGLPKLLMSVDFPTETTGYAAGYGGAMYKTTRTPLPLPQPKIVTTVDTLAISPVMLGDSTIDYVDISSGSAAPLVIDAIEFEQPSVAANKGWSFETDEPLPYTVSAGGKLALTVKIVPKDTATLLEQILILSSNDKTTPKKRILIQVQVTPAAAPKGTLSNTAIEFGTVALGKSSTKKLTLYSKGTADLVIESIRLMDNTVGFSLLSLPTLPLSISPDDSMDVTLRFSPIASGSGTTKLHVTTNDPNNSTFSVTLSGKGEIPASVDNEEATVGLQIYPHPVRDVVHIKGVGIDRALSVRIYNTLGAVVGECTVQKNLSQGIGIEVDSLAPGNYTCIVSDSFHQLQALPFVVVR